MSTPTLAQIEAGVQAALNLAAAFAPLAALAGPSGAAVGSAVVMAADAVNTVIAQVEGDASIIASGDLAQIKALQSQLAAQRHAFVSTL